MSNKEKEFQMKYTDAVKRLFEVMEGRPDIIKVEFDRDNDLFYVVSDSGIHLCLGDEFRRENEPSLNVGDKVKVLANDDPELGFEVNTIGTIVANMSTLGYDNPYQVQANGQCWWYKAEQISKVV